jgi:predicted metal-binding membrane protein
MRVHVHDRRLVLALLALLSALAWLVLWGWGQSPYGRFLSHEVLGHDAPVDGGWLLLPLVYVAGWLVMTVAMMLPTSLPLIGLFHSLTRRRPDQAALVSLLIAGYLATWLLVGIVIHAGDWGLHSLVERTAWLHKHSWLFGVTILALAGIYQYTPLKHHCLDKCRSPLSFVAEHWRGRGERVQAWWLGVHHGLFCVGCCWALMLLMFAVGVGSLGWMLALGVVMAIEKNLPWGRRLSAPLGAALLVWAAGLLLLHALAPGAVSAHAHQH